MEELILLQLAQKELLEKFIVNYNKDGKERRTRKYYMKRLQDFQDLWHNALDRHRELLVMKLSNPADAGKVKYFEEDTFSQMESHFITSYASMEERFEKDFPIGSLSTLSAGQSPENQPKVMVVRQKCEDSLKLPKISLDKFYGDYKRWPAFHDLFKTLVHENESLSNVQKLQYLKLHLGGEAENLLRYFQVIDNNYETAWNLLKDRYNNKRVLVNTHLKTLLSQGSITQETAQGIKNLLDTTTKSLHALKNLEIVVDHWDVLIVYLIVQRLPSETHQLWEQSLTTQKDLPSWDNLKNFLNCSFRTLEAITSRKQVGNKDNRNKNLKLKLSHQAFHAAPGIICCVCAGQHSIRQCTKFASMDTTKRLDVVKSKGLCLNCLGFGHMLANCPSQQRCLHCRRRHHSLLHKGQHETSVPRQGPFIRQESAATHSNQVPTTSKEIGHPQIQSSLSVSSPLFTPQNDHIPTSQINSFFINDTLRNREILLATALVRIIAPSGREQIVRALIDQGSQASFVSETIIQDLRLPKETVRAEISGIGQTNAGQVKARVHLIIKPRVNDAITIEATGLVLKRLTHLLPSRRIITDDWNHLHGLDLADQDGLIKGGTGLPIAQNTLFGWILSGEAISGPLMEKTVNNFHIVADLNTQLTRFWELEELKLEKIPNKEEQRCEEIFVDTYRRMKDGRYEVALPFQEPNGTQPLGKSRTTAISRLIQIETRFKRNADLELEYKKCLREYIELEHMKELRSNADQIETDDITTYPYAYLPHHPVIKDDSTTTKLRVVFDASAKTSNGTSLNDVLLKGPTIQDELACLLLRWRKYQIAFTADIEKMYRQIRLKPEHTEFHRIVWRESTMEPVKEYKLLTVTFGTKSAPYLATRVLQQLALDEIKTYPIGSEAALREFYVDDLLSGADTAESAIEKQGQLIGLLKSGGFNLRKWASNCSQLLNKVPKEHQEKTASFCIDPSDQVKALGLYWNTSSDKMCYSLRLGEQKGKCTKRTISSDVAKLFDPLGWAAPSIIMAKIFIQKLWLEKLDWDEDMPRKLERECITFREKLLNLDTIKLPRWINFSDTCTAIEIHGFCDASMMAYAAVTYICVIDSKGNRKAAILAAKTKVAPIKTVSLPRLELCGAVLLAKLLKYVTTALQISNYTTYAWTDSEIVLAWIKGHPCKWKTFVANRISHIHELSGSVKWRHVSSKDNPADCATRGLLPADLRNNILWWNRPTWLSISKTAWPNLKDVPSTNLEAKTTTITCMQILSESIEENYSSLTKLLRIIAYCYRFKSKEKGFMKAKETNEALMLLIRKVQTEHFSEEIKSLKCNHNIKASSRLIRLTPFLHSDGLLRVGGRLQYSELTFEEKLPIILPVKSHVTKLILYKIHKETLHGGSQLMMRILAKRYWLLNARNLSRFHIHRCVPCCRQRAEVQAQLMGNLARPRVTMSRPFSHVGIDYCGPFEIRRHRSRGAKTYKGYVAIFICLAVKALHIEIATDLSAEGFLAAFKRFTARRGLCSDVYCDCGTNFIGGNTILTRQRQRMVNDLNMEIAKAIENEGVTFHFNPIGSPNFGGLWEAGVKSTKFHMKRILGTAILTYEELSTTLTQIEACLNSRPLCATSNDPNDITALTPAHFLIGDILLTTPEPSVLDTNIHRLDRWKYVQHLYQSFWRRWSTEYLCRLQQRPKWMQKQRNLQIGELVLLKEENLPPSRWLLGKIINTHPGSDELVRVVTVKTRNSIFKRPVTKICRLPIEPVGNEIHETQGANVENRE